MLESDLSQPVSDWLVSRDFTPYAEVSVPYYGPRVIDLVGRRGCELIAVELKRSLTRAVIHQTYICDLFTDERYAAVGTKPNEAGINMCRKSGIGLLSVRGGAVNVILNPRPSGFATGERDFIRQDWARKIHAQLDHAEPFGIAGMPCRKGVGPAQECYDRVQEYLKANTAATWKEIFANVRNHYVSAKSMCSAMKVVAEGRRTENATTSA